MLQKTIKKELNLAFLLTDLYKSQMGIITVYNHVLQQSSTQETQDTLHNLLYEEYAILFELRKAMTKQGIELPSPATEQMIQAMKEKHQPIHIANNE